MWCLVGQDGSFPQTLQWNSKCYQIVSKLYFSALQYLLASMLRYADKTLLNLCIYMYRAKLRLQRLCAGQDHCRPSCSLVLLRQFVWLIAFDSVFLEFNKAAWCVQFVSDSFWAHGKHIWHDYEPQQHFTAVCVKITHMVCKPNGAGMCLVFV